MSGKLVLKLRLNLAIDMFIQIFTASRSHLHSKKKETVQDTVYACSTYSRSLDARSSFFAFHANWSKFSNVSLFPARTHVAV